MQHLHTDKRNKCRRARGSSDSTATRCDGVSVALKPLEIKGSNSNATLYSLPYLKHGGSIESPTKKDHALKLPFPWFPSDFLRNRAVAASHLSNNASKHRRIWRNE
jgi:hypothetical protein